MKLHYLLRDKLTILNSTIIQMQFIRALSMTVQRVLRVSRNCCSSDNYQSLLSDRRFVTRMISLEVFLHFCVGHGHTNQEQSS